MKTQNFGLTYGSSLGHDHLAMVKCIYIYIWRNTMRNNAFIVRRCNFFLGIDKRHMYFMGEHSVNLCLILTSRLMTWYAIVIASQCRRYHLSSVFVYLFIWKFCKTSPWGRPQGLCSPAANPAKFTSKAEHRPYFLTHMPLSWQGKACSACWVPHWIT